MKKITEQRLRRLIRKEIIEQKKVDEGFYHSSNIKVVKDNFSKKNTITIKDKDTGKVHTIFFDDYDISKSPSRYIHGNALAIGYDQYSHEWSMEVWIEPDGEIPDWFPDTIEEVL